MAVVVSGLKASFTFAATLAWPGHTVTSNLAEFEFARRSKCVLFVSLNSSVKPHRRSFATSRRSTLQEESALNSMSCAGAPSLEEPRDGCPIPAHQQGVALGFIAGTLILSAGGLALIGFRRKEPLVFKRGWLNSVLLVFVSALAQVSAYFGSAFQCWAFFVINYALAALLPGLALARFIGLYARHLRQAEAVRATSWDHRDAEMRRLNLFTDIQGSIVHDTSAREEAAPAASVDDAARRRVASTPRLLHSYAAWIGPLVLRLRIDTPGRGLLATLLTCIPWAAYSIVRFLLPSVRTSSDVGCEVDRGDVAMVAVVSCVGPVLVLPAVWHLALVPDTLLLRFECLVQVACWPPMLAWLLVDSSLPPGQHTVFKGMYGIVLGCWITLVTAMWIPALATFSESQTRPAAPLRVRVSVTRDASALEAAEGQQGLYSTLALPMSRTSASGATSRDHTLQSQVSHASVQSRPSARSSHSRPTPHTDASAATRRPGREVSQRSRRESIAAPVSLPAMSLTISRFVVPPPSVDELLGLLEAPSRCCRESSRAMGLFAAALISTESGRALLYETLRLDLSAEFLGFLMDSEGLRCAAEEWLTEALGGGSDYGGPSSSRIIDGMFSDFQTRLGQLVARYVEFSAPHYVSLSGIDAAALVSAARMSAGTQHGVDGTVEVVERVLVAIANAEVDVFEMVIDPVRVRMRVRPDLFDTWAAAFLRDARCGGIRDSVPPTAEGAAATATSADERASPPRLIGETPQWSTPSITSPALVAAEAVPRVRGT